MLACAAWSLIKQHAHARRQPERRRDQRAVLATVERHRPKMERVHIGRTFLKLWLASATLAAVRRPHHQSQHRLRHCRTKLRSVFGRRAAAPHPSHHAPSPTALAVPLASILLPLLASSPSPLPMHAPALVHCAPHLVGRRPRLPPLHARRGWHKVGTAFAVVVHGSPSPPLLPPSLPSPAPLPSPLRPRWGRTPSDAAAYTASCNVRDHLREWLE